MTEQSRVAGQRILGFVGILRSGSYNTIAGLAEKPGLELAKLEASVSEFNAARGDSEWDPVKMDGKKTSGITPPKSNWANPIV